MACVVSMSRSVKPSDCIKFPSLSIALLLLVYLGIQVQHFTPAYQEVDPDGYLFLAKRIAHLQPLAVRDEDPFMYQMHTPPITGRHQACPICDSRL